MVTKKKIKEYYEKQLEKLGEELKDEINLNMKYIKLAHDTQDKLLESEKEKIQLQKEIEQLHKEIDIYREYYNTDREPTEDEQTKILMNLRIHDLERELLYAKSELYQTKLSLNNSQQIKSVYLSPYGSYIL